MVFTNKIFLLIFFVFLSSTLYCQDHQGKSNSKKPSFYHTLYYAETKTADTVHLKEEATSLSISIGLDDNFGNALLVVDRDTFEIREDLHEPPGENEKFSQLIIFDKPVKAFVFVRGGIKGDIIFHLLNSCKTPDINNHRNNRKLDQGCGKPNTIDQSAWRAGLPAPNYTPSYSKVNHVIVHHTAGSNSNMDFTNVVRQIYLYHTEVRNYSDIGYNFLIAQDGSIYEGREGAGDNEEDVIGAHFCAKNTNTMGISLLGNYDTAIPTNAMLGALEHLIGWKLYKDNMDPFATTSHPVGNAGASSLGIIAGHRDGCATQCPGNNVYALMNIIKQNAFDVKKELGSEMPVLVVVANQRQGPGTVALEVAGGQEGGYIWFTAEDFSDSIPGAKGSKYVTPPLDENTDFYVAIKSGNCIGPLLKIEAIINEDRFLVYPNPADGMVTVTLNESFKPSRISILNSAGKSMADFEANVVNNKILLDTSTLSRGMYFLVFKSGDRKINKKLIVE